MTSSKNQHGVRPRATPKPRSDLSRNSDPISARRAHSPDSSTPREGDHVHWGKRPGAGGVVEETYRAPVSKTFKGTEIQRDATPEEPALLITTDKGDQTLKSAAEVKPDAVPKRAS